MYLLVTYGGASQVCGSGLCGRVRQHARCNVQASTAVQPGCLCQCKRVMVQTCAHMKPFTLTTLSSVGWPCRSGLRSLSLRRSRNAAAAKCKML